jgi:hypothetical protein
VKACTQLDISTNCGVMWMTACYREDYDGLVWHSTKMYGPRCRYGIFNMCKPTRTYINSGCLQPTCGNGLLAKRVVPVVGSPTWPKQSSRHQALGQVLTVAKLWVVAILQVSRTDDFILHPRADVRENMWWCAISCGLIWLDSGHLHILYGWPTTSIQLLGMLLTLHASSDCLSDNHAHCRGHAGRLDGTLTGCVNGEGMKGQLV